MAWMHQLGIAPDFLPQIIDAVSWSPSVSCGSRVSAFCRSTGAASAAICLAICRARGMRVISRSAFAGCVRREETHRAYARMSSHM